MTGGLVLISSCLKPYSGGWAEAARGKRSVPFAPLETATFGEVFHAGQNLKDKNNILAPGWTAKD